MAKIPRQLSPGKKFASCRRRPAIFGIGNLIPGNFFCLPVYDGDSLDMGTCILPKIRNPTEYWLNTINFQKSVPLSETLANTYISMMFTNVQKDKIAHVKNSRFFNYNHNRFYNVIFNWNFFNVRLRNSWTCTSHKGQKNFMALGPCQKTNFYFRWYYFIDLLKDSIIILWQTLDSFCVVRGVIT